MRFDDPSVHSVAARTLPAPPAFVIEALKPHVTPHRLARIEEVARHRTLAVTPVLENVADPWNGAAVLRSCDAFGIHRVHVVADERPFYGTTKVTRGADRWLDIVVHATPELAAEALVADGFQIFVADMEGEHTPETLASVPRAAIVFGNEHRGVGSALRERAHGHYRVPMCGFVESLNVSVAAAVTLYEVAKSRPRVTGDARDLVVAQLLHATVHDSDRLVGELFRRASGTTP